MSQVWGRLFFISSTSALTILTSFSNIRCCYVCRRSASSSYWSSLLLSSLASFSLSMHLSINFYIFAYLSSYLSTFQYFLTISSNLLFRNCLYFSQSKYRFSRSWYSLSCRFAALEDKVDYLIIEVSRSFTPYILAMDSASKICSDLAHMSSSTVFILACSALSLRVSLAKIQNMSSQDFSMIWVLLHFFLFEGVVILFEL